MSVVVSEFSGEGSRCGMGNAQWTKSLFGTVRGLTLLVVTGVAEKEIKDVKMTDRGTEGR